MNTFSFLSLSLLLSLGVNGIYFAPSPNEEGKPCRNGVVSNPCKDGYVCFFTKPGQSASGFCVKEAQLGDPCGGSTQFPPKCKSNLICYLSEADKNIPGRQGQCRPLAGDGQPCNTGGVRYPPVCDDDHSCVFPRPVPGQMPIAGLSGKCVKKVPKYK